METIRNELLPLLQALCELAREEGQLDQAAFFERIRTGIANAQEFDDMAGPFMDLSTSAFRGFEFSLPLSLLLDRALEAAHVLAQTLSVNSDQAH
jgi:hypothetical protein